MTLARIFFPLILTSASLPAELLDLAPFARPCCSTDKHTLQTTFDYNHPKGLVRAADGRGVYGLQWAEERDLFEVAVRFLKPYDARKAVVEYWFKNWPYPPPQMPSTEDPVDDPWQGQWLAARTSVTCHGVNCRIAFAPLEESENRLAKNLSGVPYRRAMRFRLVFPAGELPEIEAVQVFSQSQVKRIELSLRFLDGGSERPSISAYNGWVRSVKPFRGGAQLTLDAAQPAPAGSHDVTIVEVRRGNRAFSFAPEDVEKGPLYVPDYRAYITLASDTRPFSEGIVKAGNRIRQRVEREPEQTYERATAEIPALDPIKRQGDRLYLPLAADASWQKFAFEWGGNVMIRKRATKAYGRELARLTWPRDEIRWSIDTRPSPTFDPRDHDASLSVLEDHLPIATARWKEGAIEYEEEAFATLLEGPLSSEDASRNEQTPAVLMIRLRARNTSAAPAAAHLWMKTSVDDSLALDGRLVIAGAGVRARADGFAGSRVSIESQALHATAPVAAGGEASAYLAIPFVPGLTTAERARLLSLDYASERSRVLAFWRQATNKGIPFRVPEQRFNSFAKGLIARIRISATKDPASGLYMVPAASYYYRVFANEAAFQSQLLDLTGYRDLSGKYLQTLVELQGSKPFPGTYTEQSAVYHGARVNSDYDYTASNYGLDHGTVLWTLAQHYLIARDRAWLGRVVPGMKRAADWVIAQRRLTQVLVDGEPCPEYGLLPAGHLEDNSDWGHWFSVNAYAWLGMHELARALADVGDADAARYAREAEAYRKDLRAAVDRAAASAPVVKLRDNTWVPYVPTRVHQRIRLFGPIRSGYYSRYGTQLNPTYRLSATRELLYGPLILVDTGVIDANQTVAGWIVDDWEDNATTSEPLGLHVHGWVDEQYWFSRGGMVFQANLQNPIRAYLRRGDAPAAIRSLYNNFVSCYYPTVNIFTEEYRQWRGPSGPFYKIPDEAKFVHRLRDMLVTEYDGDLLLAAATPERWLAPGQEIAVDHAPTEFGPMSYTLRGETGLVRGRVELPQRNSYRDAWLRVRAPGGRIASVLIDGRAWTDFDAGKSRIRLPSSARPLSVVVRFTSPGASR
jgi:hypothetical protein